MAFPKHPFAFGLLLVLLSAGNAFAHAQLAAAIPQPDGTVTAAPATITLNFTETLEGKLSSIRVHNSNGTEVERGDAYPDRQNERRLIVALQPLEPGIYTVTWKVTGTDTHRTSGVYTFIVASSANPSQGN